MQTPQPIDNSVWTTEETLSSNVTVSNKDYSPFKFTPNPRQTLCWAINELEDLVKLTPTDNNTKALRLLKEALSLL